MALDWYFLRVQVGREDKIRTNMLARIKQGGLEEKIPQVIVPVETVAEVRGGKKRIQRKKLYPGYLMVQMDYSDETWFALRETPGFGEFVGVRTIPAPASPNEVEAVLGRMDSSKEQPKMAINFNKGDRVKIKEGPFENMDATVEDVHPDKGTLEVAVNIFGRATPMTVGYWEVEAI